MIAGYRATSRFCNIDLYFHTPPQHWAVQMGDKRNHLDCLIPMFHESSLEQNKRKNRAREAFKETVNSGANISLRNFRIVLGGREATIGNTSAVRRLGKHGMLGFVLMWQWCDGESETFDDVWEDSNLLRAFLRGRTGCLPYKRGSATEWATSGCCGEVQL